MSDADPAEIAEIDVTAARDLLAERQAVMIDVREAQEYEFEHVPGALLQSLSFLDPDYFPDLGDRRLIFVCAVGKRSAAAVKQLQKAGFSNLLSMTGGIDAWREANYDLEGARFETHDYMI
jgi:rhodanese-related sulfurtransferase